MSHHQPSNFATSHQELSLYAYVSAERQPQLFKILSGITGMAPESFFNHHLVFKPRQPKISPSATDLFYIQLVSRVPADDTREYKPREQGWSMRLNDIPEVTRKPVISRAVYSANTGAGDAIEFVEELGYTYIPPPFPSSCC
jgi:mediator of RNA polymerase II transcription subunit 18